MDSINIDKIKAAEEALKVMADFFYPENCTKIGIPERPDEKGWFYVNKETADKFKKEYLKYIFR